MLFVTFSVTTVTESQKFRHSETLTSTGKNFPVTESNFHVSHEKPHQHWEKSICDGN